VLHDPHDRLAGGFDATVGPEGLKLWRGKGRRLLAGPGCRAEHLGDAELRVEIDGRPIEFAVLHPQAAELARQVADYLSGRRDDVALAAPTSATGGLILAAVPLALPLFALLVSAVAAAIWLPVALVLCCACVLIALRSSWSPATRVWASLGISGIGFLAFETVVLARMLGAPSPDGPPQPVPPVVWRDWSSADGQWRAQVPGIPQRINQTVPGFEKPFRTDVVKVQESRATFLIGYLDMTEPELDRRPPAAWLDAARDAHRASLPGSLVRTDRALQLGAHPAREWELRAPGQEPVATRMIVAGRRFVLLQHAGPAGSLDNADTQRFFGSLTLQPTGRPGDPLVRGAGGAPRPPEVPRLPIGPGPANPPQPTTPTFNNLPAGGGKFTSTATVVAVGVSADGRTMVVTSADGTLTRWDLPGRRVQSSLRANLADAPVTAALSPDGRYQAVGSSSGQVQLIDWTMNSQRELVRERNVAFWCAAFSPDGKTLATGHGDGEVRLWNVRTGTLSSRIANGDGQVLSVAWSGDGRLLAAGGQNRTVKVYLAATRAFQFGLSGHQQPAAPWDGVKGWQWHLRALALSPDGNLAVSGGNDRTMRVSDIANRRQVRSILHSDALTALAIHPGGKLVATGTADGAVRINDASTGGFRGQINSAPFGPDPLIRSIAFLPDGRYLVWSLGTAVELVDLSRRGGFTPDDLKLPAPRPATPPAPRLSPVTAFPVGNKAALTAFTMCTDGTRLATVSADGKGRVYDTRTLKLQAEHPTLAASTVPLLSRDGSTLVLLTQRRAQVVNVNTNTTRIVTGLGAWSAAGASVSPDGKTLALSSATLDPDTKEYVVKLFDLDGGNAKWTAKFGKHRVIALAFTPDGKKILAGAAGEADLRSLDAATGAEGDKRTPAVPSVRPGVSALGFAGTGTTLISGSVDGWVRTWSVEDTKQRTQFLAMSGGVGQVALEPKGELAAAARGGDEFIFLIDLVASRHLTQLRHDNTRVIGFGFDRDGAHLFVGTADGQILRWELAKLSAVAKRPKRSRPPAQPPIPNPAWGTKGVARVGPFDAAVIDATRKRVLVAKANRLSVLSYPDFNPIASPTTDARLYRLAADEKAGRLYALASRKVSILVDGLPRGYDAEFRVYDLQALAAMTADGAMPKPLLAVPSNGRLVGLLLAPDGRSLYALDGKDVRDTRVLRIEAETGKVAGSASLGGPAVSLCLAPDGKALYTATIDLRAPAAGGRRGTGKVLALDPATLATRSSGTVEFLPGALACGPDGLLYVSKTGIGSPSSVVALDPAQAFAIRVENQTVRTRVSLRIAPDGKRLYASARLSSQPPLLAWTLPLKADSQPLAVTDTASGGSGDFVLSPEGQYALVGRNGGVYRIADMEQKAP
jgi:WD40 repeat protein